MDRRAASQRDRSLRLDSLGRSFGIAGWETADLEQLQAECLELVDHAVQGGLVRERADQQRVLTASARGQRRERLHHRRADRPADADLVAPRLASPGRSVFGCHAIRVGVRGVSAHRIVRTNPRLSIPGCNHVRVVADSGAAVESAGSGVRAWLVPRPGLFERLGAAERVVHVSAPAGSGKTFLLRSWIAAEGLGDRVAWVSVGREEHDPQAFWLSVLDSLRGTRIGSERVRELTAAPGLDGATVVRRLLEDLGSLDERVWLVIDDLHELHAEEAIHQVELLLGSAPPQLRFVLSTRRDLRLGLHRLRVEGELTEIRGEDLRFTRGRVAGAAGGGGSAVVRRRA